MDYQEALRKNTWKTERKLADKILNYINRHNLNYKLDKLTRGLGNCFPLSVLQQIMREDIFDSVKSDIRAIAQRHDHQEFRKRLRKFVLTSKDERLEALEENFRISNIATANLGEDTETWKQYWDNMMGDGKWVDSFFVQATSFFLNLNIDIIETSGNETRPFHTMYSEKPNSNTISIGYVTGKNDPVQL